MSNRTLLIMAGGTGGHIFPALAIAALLQDKGWKIVWLGAADAMETRLVPERAPYITLETLKITGVRGKGTMKFLVQPWVQFKAVCKAIHIIFHYRPDVVVGFGGFTSFAGGIAARLLWRPLVIHEQNSVAGLTNRVLSKIANRVLFAFPAAFPAKTGLTGNPVRRDLLDLPRPAERFAGRQGPLKILVIGGSLGARVLNTNVPKAIALLPEEKRPIVLHQAGTKNVTQAQENYDAAGVVATCVPFIDDMGRVLTEADLVICRSGALTVAELSAVGVAAILVPFAAAVDDHQTGNARYLSDEGAGILIAQSALTPEVLAYYLETLTRPDLVVMAQSARALAKPNATEDIVEVIETMAKTV